MKKIHAFQYFSFFDLLKRILQFFEHFAVENCRFFSMNKFMAWFFHVQNASRYHHFFPRWFSVPGKVKQVSHSQSTTDVWRRIVQQQIRLESFQFSPFSNANCSVICYRIYGFLSRKLSKILLCIWKSDIFDTSSPWRKTN